MSIEEILYNKATTQYEILMTPIHLLEIQLQGSKIDRLIRQVRKELKSNHLVFNPSFYLSDEFGCVKETINVGIPFYMVDSELEELNRIVGSEKYKVLEDHQIKALLRHECGHAFFYAYEIEKNKTANRLFESFDSKPIPLKRTDPKSPDYVDYLGLWGAASVGYSQTHPEEDFSDTFGAWLDPSENKYSFHGKALKKLEFMEKLTHKYAGKKPHPASEDFHRPQHSIKETVESFFQRRFGPFDLEAFKQKATGFIDHHLTRAFLAHPSHLKTVIYASQFLKNHKKQIIRETRKWVRNPSWLNYLIEKSIERTHSLQLAVPGGNIKRARKIFSAILMLLTTLLEEKGRIE